MSKELETLERLAYENACCRCQYYKSNECFNKGECVWKTIEKDLKRLEQLEIMYSNCVFEGAKQKKTLENIKELFDFDFALRFPSNQPMLRITNKRTNEYWEIPISKEEYDLLRGDVMRLTKKIDLEELGYDYVLINEAKQPSANYKLGQLEDIERELGIDLITLIKAQTQGFYIVNVFGEIEKVKLSEWRFNLIKKEVHRVKWNDHLLFVDYGKTWALTREELE